MSWTSPSTQQRWRPRAIAPLLYCELDGLLEPLSHGERRDVRDMSAVLAFEK